MPRRVGGRSRPLRLGRGRARRARRPARPVRLRRRPRRVVGLAHAACDRGAPAPRPRRARALLPLPRVEATRRRRGPRGGLRRARARARDLRALRADPARGVRRRPARRVARLRDGARRSRCPDRARGALGAAARRRDTLAQPEPAPARGRPRAVREPARRLVAPPLPGRARAARAGRPGRRGRARAGPARGVRRTPAVERVRARRNGRDPGADARADAVRPLLGRDVAVAGAARGRLRPVRVRVRRRARAPRPDAARRARRARGGNRRGAGVARRLRVRPAPWRPGARDVDRVRRRDRRDRRRALAPPAQRARVARPGRRRRRALRAPDRRARLPALDAAQPDGPVRALVRAPRRAARRPGRRDRDREPAGELPHRRRRARVRRRRAAPARREHDREPAVRARAGRPAVARDRRSGGAAAGTTRRGP